MNKPVTTTLPLLGEELVPEVVEVAAHEGETSYTAGVAEDGSAYERAGRFCVDIRCDADAARVSASRERSAVLARVATKYVDTQLFFAHLVGSSSSSLTVDWTRRELRSRTWDREGGCLEASLRSRPGRKSGQTAAAVRW